jgi:hypothetical protein
MKDNKIGRQAGRRTDRQTNREAGRQADGTSQAGWQADITDRQADMQTGRVVHAAHSPEHTEHIRKQKHDNNTWREGFPPK